MLYEEAKKIQYTLYSDKTILTLYILLYNFSTNRPDKLPYCAIPVFMTNSYIINSFSITN